MANTFEVGDIVVLKSGGPKMTVQMIYSDGDIATQWFAGAKLEHGRFKGPSLQTAPAEPKKKDA